MLGLIFYLIAGLTIIAFSAKRLSEQSQILGSI